MPETPEPIYEPTMLVTPITSGTSAPIDARTWMATRLMIAMIGAPLYATSTYHEIARHAVVAAEALLDQLGNGPYSIDESPTKGVRR